MARDNEDEELKKNYQEMADLTRPFCGKCPAPVSCCSPEYCEITIKWAKDKWGVELQKTDHPSLPLMGPLGCTVAPHLRPQCTYHVCSMNSLGVLMEAAYGPINKEATEKYFKLREKIDILEFEREERLLPKDLQRSED